MNKWFFCALPVAICALSCSVKENRMECPCLLEVSLTGGNDSKTVVSVWNRNLVKSCSVINDEKQKWHEIDIPRGQFTVAGCCGLRHNLPLDGRLVLAKGEEMDEIYAASSPLTAVADTVFGRLSLHKQFTFINVKILCVKGHLPENIILDGSTSGMNLKTMEPVAGNFEVCLHPIFGEFCRASVPRQLDSSLRMTIEGFGEVPLGEYIAESGYDWTATDLEDIEITVDLSECRLILQVVGWMESKIFAITI